MRFRRIRRVGQTYRNIKRYTEIVSILIKHGFGEIITRTKIDRIINLGNRIMTKKGAKGIEKYSHWQRIRMAFEEMGPTFIKFGQIMSNRPDLIPPQLVLELEKLQSEVKPFPEHEAIKVIEEELQQPISKLFRKFYPIPLASASIAQVHKAELLTGEVVAVKIMRPGIKKIIAVDLEIMSHLAELLEKNVDEMETVHPTGIVQEFATTLRKEIDFTIEAIHIKRFTDNFSSNPHIYIPKVYEKYTTQRVLVMEYIDGIKVNRIEEIKKQGCNPKIIAERGSNLVLKQIFEYGFFHADPHPGNIFILKNNIICLLDFGMMGVLLPRYREYLADLIIAIVQRDSRKVTKSLLRFSVSSHEVNVDEFENKIAELIDQISHLPINKIDMNEIINRSVQMVVEYKLRMPPPLYLLSKAIITIDGVARKLDPEFDMLKQLEPYAKNLIKERLSARKLLKKSYFTVIETIQLLQDFPIETRELIKQLRRGNIRFEIEHKGLEPMINKHEQISNRLSFTIILASLIIGSSLIVLSKVPPLLFDVPIIGIFGYLIAGIMGFALLISMMRSGKM